jgi:hypothetical protein
LKLALDVITDSSNKNLKQVQLPQNSKLQKSTALTKKSHPNDVNIYSEEGIFSISHQDLLSTPWLMGI